jgi:hypothetical protein
MKPLTNQELGRLAAELGHDQLALVSLGEGTKKGLRWIIYCSCGWDSKSFVLAAAAIGAGKHHLRFNVEKSLRNGGRVLLRDVGAVR